MGEQRPDGDRFRIIYSVVDVLLGRNRTLAIRVEGRPYTTIETRLIERMSTVVLNDLSSAFDPLALVILRLTVWKQIHALPH